MQSLNHTSFRILLIDDELRCTKLMEAILRQAGFEQVTMANDSREAIRLYEEVKPDLVALDMKMPVMDGIEVMRQLLPMIDPDDYLPIIMITGELDAATKHRALAEGAKDFLNKPVDPIEVVLRIKNQLMTRVLHQQLRLHNEHLEAQVLLRTKVVEQTQLDLLYRLTLASCYREDTSGSHAWRVGNLAARLAELSGQSQAQVELIKRTAPLHDLGKVGIPDRTLMKTTPYDAQDRDAIKQHTKIGSKLLSGSTAPLFVMAREIALMHHERWDGTGYHGVKGAQIPISARIVALVDAFDVMTHPSSYKPAMPLKEAKAEIERQAGAQFDPTLVNVFLQLIDREGDRLLSEASPVRLVA
ncbi:MAG: Cyclic di-GMP phosphodiesterase [Nitrospirae bacterium]|nr:MAG: response regulator [Nitrospira sp. OLB3]MBV6468914.1 Cyclic di-GMP phosphodiesterase [Nitrospirota bacterium]MCE7966128.1 response regulator [Nitrospira sp. NTP2]MCK6492908.1 response regulator [Nitrospira sp.]MEB2339159.1 response regulator [Nitrospirales bacterium]